MSLRLATIVSLLGGSYAPTLSTPNEVIRDLGMRLVHRHAGWVMGAPVVGSGEGPRLAAELLEAWAEQTRTDGPDGRPGALVIASIADALQGMVASPYLVAHLPPAFLSECSAAGFTESLGAQLLRGAANCDGTNGILAMACRSLGSATLRNVPGGHRIAHVRLHKRPRRSRVHRALEWTRDFVSRGAVRGAVFVDPYTCMPPFHLGTSSVQGSLSLDEATTVARARNAQRGNPHRPDASADIFTASAYRRTSHRWRASESKPAAPHLDLPEPPARICAYLMARVHHLAGDHREALAAYRSLDAAHPKSDDWATHATRLWIEGLVDGL